MNTSMQKVSVPVPVVVFPGGAEGVRRRGIVLGVVSVAVLVASLCVFMAGLHLWTDLDTRKALSVSALPSFAVVVAMSLLVRKVGLVPPAVPSSAAEVEATLLAAGVPGAVAADAAKQADTGFPSRPKMDRRMIVGGEEVYRASAEVVGPRIVDIGDDPARLEVEWETLTPR